MRQKPEFLVQEMVPIEHLSPLTAMLGLTTLSVKEKLAFIHSDTLQGLSFDPHQALASLLNLLTRVLNHRSSIDLCSKPRDLLALQFARATKAARLECHLPFPL